MAKLEPGQRAYEAWVAEAWARGFYPKLPAQPDATERWALVGDDGKACWAVAEQALSVPEPAASEREGAALALAQLREWLESRYNARDDFTRDECGAYGRAIIKLDMLVALCEAEAGKAPCSCHSCEVLPELHEQVAQMCEFLGSKREEVPCDSWHLRDLITKLKAEADKAQAEAWHRIPELPLPRTEGAELDLPDSGVWVMVSTEEGADVTMARLEFTDDSEGHGEPYWEAVGGDLALCNYPWWMPIPALPSPPSEASQLPAGETGPQSLACNVCGGPDAWPQSVGPRCAEHLVTTPPLGPK